MPEREPVRIIRRELKGISSGKHWILGTSGEKWTLRRSGPGSRPFVSFGPWVTPGEAFYVVGQASRKVPELSTEAISDLVKVLAALCQCTRKLYGR